MGPQGGASIALSIIASLLLAGYTEACYDAYGYYYDCGYRPYYRTRWYVSTWAYIGYSVVALIIVCVILCIILAAVFTPRRDPQPRTTMTVVQTPYDAPPAPPPPVTDAPAPPPPVVLQQPPPAPSTPTKTSPVPAGQPQGAVPAGQPQIVYAVTDAQGQVKYYSQPPPNTPPPPPPQQNQPQVVYV
uniref:CX domain-containing protein n=1 Tax=Panagrellus redivivus TaxID=6233 RepID=A0A7E4VZT4_PANRE